MYDSVRPFELELGRYHPLPISIFCTAVLFGLLTLQDAEVAFDSGDSIGRNTNDVYVVALRLDSGYMYF